MYSEKKVIKLNEYIKQLLRKNNCYINEFYYRPYHPKASVIKYRRNSNLRKPKNGIFLKIKKDWDISSKNTIMIGDRHNDIQFAKNCKIKSFLFNEKNLFLFIRKHFYHFIYKVFY
tara:strand:- start:150 stop:497 length:348 start_codon:yes stop_codon:yes gene_type:complete